ncbi:MAG: alpha/beta fold hydrolase [Rhodospirillales bacterium]|nr:alpha/beta fold hydrolase [Rhodospirillales bacterium]
MVAIPGRQLQIADFTLDLDAAELRRGGDVVAIEPQVFDLIALLASQAGRVISRDEIIQAVWRGRIVSDSAISTRINAARRALGDDGVAQTFIKTVHRRGFRFMVQPRSVAPPAPGAAEAAVGDALEVRYCKAEDGIRLAYAALGSGPPLVKAAHYLTHLQFDTESLFHRHWVRELSKGNRLVRYDERGNGLSDWQIADFSFELMVKDLETVVDAMDLGRFALLGVSQGASVSIEYARRHPERVASLIIYGGYAAGWRKSANEEFRRRREAMLELMRVFWDDTNPAGRQAYASLFLPE